MQGYLQGPARSICKAVCTFGACVQGWRFSCSDMRPGSAGLTPVQTRSGGLLKGCHSWASPAGAACTTGNHCLEPGLLSTGSVHHTVGSVLKDCGSRRTGRHGCIYLYMLRLTDRCSHKWKADTWAVSAVAVGAGVRATHTTAGKPHLGVFTCQPQQLACSPPVLASCISAA